MRAVGVEMLDVLAQHGRLYDKLVAVGGIPISVTFSDKPGQKLLRSAYKALPCLASPLLSVR